MGRIVGFLEEDVAVRDGSEKVVTDGIVDCHNEHLATLRAKEEAIKKAEEDAIEAEKQNEIRKINRRAAREKRAKDQALAKYKDEVNRRVILDKGEVVTTLETNLIDMTGNFKADPVSATYGGQLQQLYYVIDSIIKKYPTGLKMYNEKRVANDDEDYFTKPNNPRELCQPEHLMPFFM